MHFKPSGGKIDASGHDLPLEAKANRSAEAKGRYAKQNPSCSAVQRKQNSTKLCDAGPLRSACIRPGTAACIGFGRTAYDLHHSALSRPSLQHMTEPLACDAGGSPAWIVERYGNLLIVRAVACLTLCTEILCKIKTLATQTPTEHEEEKLFTAIAVATLPVVPRTKPKGGLVARGEIFRTTMTRNCNFRARRREGKGGSQPSTHPSRFSPQLFRWRTPLWFLQHLLQPCCTLATRSPLAQEDCCTAESPHRLLNRIGTPKR